MAKSKVQGPFKPGDIVRLKSGGPDMVVESVSMVSYNDEPHVMASWFGGAKRHRETFKLDAIELVPENERRNKK